MRIARATPLVILLVLLAAPRPGSAQGVTVDQGTFRILAAGAEVGTEDFAIRRAGSGADLQLVATAEIRLNLPAGNTNLVPLLQASGSDMAVSAYQLKVSGGSQEEVVVHLGDRRYLSTVRSERGEREREFRAATGTVLLDPDVAHQYHFVAARLGDENSATIPVISPREGRQFDLRVEVVAASTTVDLVEGSASARHLRLEGDGRRWDLWVDTEGRVLRVEDQERDYVAIRIRAP